MNKIQRLVFLCVLCILAVSFCLTGCSKKKKEIAVFTYEELENGTLAITGLTDKGKTDVAFTVPSQIEGKDVSVINAGAFRDDANVTKVVISEGIKSISENAFLNCHNLSEIEFPSTIESVGTNAFVNTLWYNNEIASKGEAVVGSILCAVKTGNSYTVPEGIKVISSGVFYSNNQLNELIIPEGVEKIESYAISGCSNLTSIKLPESLRVIGYGAFANSAIEDLTVPALVVSIGNEAFLNIEHVTYKGNVSGNGWGAKSYN